jgi:hypothetical protein
LENVDIFYSHLEYFTDIWYIMWPFGKFFTVLVSCTYQEKSGNPGHPASDNGKTATVAKGWTPQGKFFSTLASFPISISASFFALRLRVQCYNNYFGDFRKFSDTKWRFSRKPTY